MTDERKERETRGRNKFRGNVVGIRGRCSFRMAIGKRGARAWTVYYLHASPEYTNPAMLETLSPVPPPCVSVSCVFCWWALGEGGLHRCLGDLWSGEANLLLVSISMIRAGYLTASFPLQLHRQYSMLTKRIVVLLCSGMIQNFQGK